VSTAGLPRLLRAALAATERGWPVFPLLPGSKRPALVGWQQRATRDPDVLAAWWHRAPYNIGIACGPAGLLVVDLDGPGDPPPGWAGAADGRAVFAQLARRAGAQLAPTFTVATPSGGEHRYYTVPAGQRARSSVGLLGWRVDTRGAGGYVVAAGSVRRLDGRPRCYLVTDPRPPAGLPDWLAALLAPRPSAHRLRAPAAGRRSAYGRAAMTGETDLVRAARPGTRNAVLFRAAVRLGSLAAAGLLDEQDVRHQLAAAGSVHVGVDGFTAGEADRAITNGLCYGLSRPRLQAPPRR
jgi:hypothetical protein